MSPKKSNIRGWVLFFVSLASLALIFIPIRYYLQYFGSDHISNQESKWTFFADFIANTIGPILSFLTLAVTTWIAWEFNNYQRKQQEASDKDRLQQTTIDLFKEFRSFRMRTARDQAWELKKIWENSNNAAMKPNILKSFINEAELKESPHVTKSMIKGLYDVFAFYSMLCLYKENEQNIRNLNYFYYGWWRFFLYDFAKGYDEMKKNDINEEDISEVDKTKNLFKLDKNIFCNNISLTRPLVELDKICGFENLPNTYKIYKDRS